MKPAQIASIVNDIATNILGENATLIAEDFSNIVDVGRSFENAMALEPFYKQLHDVIVRNIYVDRPYDGALPSVLYEEWEYGSLLGKIDAELLDATTNEAYELVNGSSVDPFVINIPNVSQKFFNKGVTFEIDVTKPEDQVKGAFQSRQDMERFFAMIESKVRNSMNLRIEGLIFATIDNMIAGTYGTGTASPRCIKLLSDYNTLTSQSLTAPKALLDDGFLKYACNVIMKMPKKLEKYRTLYNAGGKPRHTPAADLHVIMQVDFATAVKTHLQSTTYHEDLVSLPRYEEVAAWQGVEDDDSIESAMKVDCTAVLPDGSGNETTASISVGYVAGVMFDHTALGVLKPERKVRSIYNPKGEYFNDFHKWTSRYFNDFDENFVIFLIA